MDWQKYLMDVKIAYMILGIFTYIFHIRHIVTKAPIAIKITYTKIESKELVLIIWKRRDKYD